MIGIDNYQLLIPLVSQTTEFNVKPLFSESNDLGAGKMKDVVIELQQTLKKSFPSYSSCHHRIQTMAQLSNRTHYIAGTSRGYALYFDITDKSFVERQIAYSLNHVIILPKEESAIFSSNDSFFIVKIPSLLCEENDKISFQSEIISLKINEKKSDIYVLLKEKIIKIKASDLNVMKNFIEGEFCAFDVSSDEDLAIFKKEGKLSLFSCKGILKHEVDIDRKCTLINFSPKCSKILMKCLKSVIIFNRNTLAIEKEISLNLPEGINIGPVCMTKDELSLVIAHKGYLSFWSADSGTKLDEIKVHKKKVWFMALSDNNKFIFTCGQEGRFSELKFPKLPKIKSQTARTFSYNISENSIILYANQAFWKWNLFSQTLIELEKFPDELWYNFRYIVVSEDVIVLYHQNCLKKINLVTKETNAVNVIGGKADTITYLRLSPDKQILATAGSSSHVFLWNISTMTVIKDLKGNHGHIRAIEFFMELNEIVAGSANGIIEYWDNSKEKPDLAQEFRAHKQKITKVKKTNDEKLLLTGSSAGTIKIWDWIQKIHIYTIKMWAGEIVQLAILSDNKTFVSATEKGRITFWDLDSYTEIFSKELGERISKFFVSKDNKHFAYCNKGSEEIGNAENKIYLISNPMNFTGIDIPTGSSRYAIYNYIHSIITCKCKSYVPELDHWIYNPYKLNSLHLYSCFNYPLHLKAALHNGIPLISTSFNENPLSLALTKNYTHCISFIISSLNKIAETNPFSLVYLDNDIISKLNLSGHPLLPKLYNAIFRKHERGQKFCDENQLLPIVHYSKQLTIDDSKFLPGDQKKDEGKPVYFRHTIIPLGLTAGSESSLRFLRSLNDTKNFQIFTTDCVQEILDYKWSSLKWMMQLQGLVYFLYLLALSNYTIGNPRDNSIFTWFLLSSLLTVYELYHFCLSPSQYIKDKWNIIDAAQALITWIYAVIIWTSIEPKIEYNILFALVVISWLRGITLFRLFEDTRYMVNLLAEVTKDMKSFLILLLYSTMAFAFIFLVLDKGDASLSYYLTISYRIDIGDFETDGLNLAQWICFFLATMINPIIMLNLLISIIGDTFSKVEEERDIAEYKELTEMIIELESIWLWRRKIQDVHYFQICNEELSDEKSNVLQKKLEKLKNAINTNQRKNNEKLDFIMKAIEETNQKIDKFFEEKV